MEAETLSSSLEGLHLEWAETRILPLALSTVRSIDISDQLESVVLEIKLEDDEVAAEISLEQSFRNLIPLNDHTAITANYITWGEYQLFLEDQTTGQFHSTAELISVPNSQLNQPVKRIRWQDARWFCAWLSTQTRLQSEEGVYDYRLSTGQKLESLTGVGFH